MKYDNRLIIIGTFYILGMVLIITTQADAQFYYPTQVGNKWIYDEISYSIGFYSRDTTSVSIVRDTLMPNGFIYSKFDRYDQIDGKFIRSDSNWIYYYNHPDSTDIPFFKLNASVDEQWNVNLYRWFTVRYLGIDSVTIFNTSTNIKRFYLDGLAVMYVYLSDKFGPIFVRDMHDPPGVVITDKFLIGAVISDTSYGIVLSVPMSDEILADYTIEQNYPNPFNSSTIIKYHIPQKEFVTIKVYNILGQEIKSLVNETKDQGSHKIKLDAGRMPSGLYLYRIKAGAFTETKKMLIIR